MLNEAYKILKETFGYTDFKEYQKEAIEKVLQKRDTFIIMPTGSGKSLCYQIPSLLLNGVTLVVSPLISLMKDQVDQLQNLGIRATYINSTLPPEEIQNRLSQMTYMKYGLVFIAPERLDTTNFRFMFEILVKNNNLNLIAVDEAHCISQWGHDFRPSYQKIRFLRKTEIPFMALTATATKKVQIDVVNQLSLRNPAFISGNFDRPNLRYLCVHPQAKQNYLLKYLEDKRNQSGIIYAGTRKRSEDIALFLKDEGFNVSFYHAGMEDEDRHNVQEAFLQDKIPIVVATNAFGMGINKPNVRFVVHYNMPGSIESYTQEAGRAGRDGYHSDCLLLFGYEDRSLQEYFINGNNPPYRLIEFAYKQITQEEITEEKLLELCRRDSAANPMSIRALTGMLQEYGYVGTLYGREGEHAIYALDRNKSLDLPKETLDIKRAIAFEKLNHMMIYCQSHHCLRNLIQSYFGFPPVPCENCSTCLVKKETVKDDESDVIHEILKCIKTLRRPYGIHLVSETLAGIKNDRILDKRLDKHLSFGALNNYSKQEIIEIIWKLIREEYIERSTDEYPVLSLTKKGRETLTEKKALLRKRKAGQKHVKTQPQLTSDEILFEKLKAYRAQKAAERRVHLHTLFSEETLREIVAHLPKTRKELLGIHGIGKYILNHFGKDLLQIVLEHCERNI